MSSSHTQNIFSSNFSYRIALIEKIQDIKNNIENIQCRIQKNEINLQNSTNKTLEEYLMEINTNNKRRARKRFFYQRQIYNDKKHLEKEEEKLEKLKEDFKRNEAERWFYCTSERSERVHFLYVHDISLVVLVLLVFFLVL